MGVGIGGNDLSALLIFHHYIEDSGASLILFQVDTTKHGQDSREGSGGELFRPPRGTTDCEKYTLPKGRVSDYNRMLVSRYENSFTSAQVEFLACCDYSLCKQFRPKSEPIDRRSISGTKLFNDNCSR